MSDIEWSPWIKHSGKGMPVPGDTMVCVRLSGGGAYNRFKAGEWNWYAEGDGRIEDYRIPMDIYIETHPDSELDADQYSAGADHNDDVNQPSHYTGGDIECIDAIRAQMSDDEFAGFLRGNVCKYLWRHRKKGGFNDLLKAQWYLNRLLKHNGNANE